MKTRILIFSFLSFGVFPTFVFAAGETKDPSDTACRLTLGWGHGNGARQAMRLGNTTGIGQGCNAGVAGAGELQNQPEWWRYQRGTNGIYQYPDFQGTQNGGLNPLILEPPFNQTSVEGTRNAYLGFMRLTQYHWLKLHDYAQLKLEKEECSSVQITFSCHIVDGDAELRKRFGAWKNPIEYIENGKHVELSEEDRSILRRIEPLTDCFDDFQPLPEHCGQVVNVTRVEKMSKACRDWVTAIDKKPQHDAQTPRTLPKSFQEEFPERGVLH